ncbi:MAG: hypothetical protein FWD53_00415 [Phycisphaerales bacterium]|nr:hypothetical protein [Phycisphaerales bacterium]
MTIIGQTAFMSSALLFEAQPWYWSFGLGAAVILFVAGRNRSSKTLIKSGLTIATITLLWMLLAWIVVTPAERLYAVHRQLAVIAKEGNVEKLFSHLSENFELPQLGIKNLAEAKAIVSVTVNNARVKNNHVRAYQSTIYGNTARTHVTFLTESDTGMTKTSWELQWQDIPGADWKIRIADLKMLNDSPVRELGL